VEHNIQPPVPSKEAKQRRKLTEDIKVTPVIDKRDRLRGVPDTIRCLEEEHARGKLAVSPDGYHCSSISVMPGGR
jgi:hypothetical protein